MIHPTLVRQYGKQYSKGWVLFQEGDPGDEVCLIASGEIKLTKLVGGTEILLAILGPGDLFGEMAYFSHEPRSATAQTLSEATILAIPGSLFEQLLRTHVDLAFILFKKLVMRIHGTNRHLEILGVADPFKRVVFHLTHEGRDVISSRELPAYLGISPGALNHALVLLEEWGMVAREERGIRILKPDELLELRQKG